MRRWLRYLHYGLPALLLAVALLLRWQDAPFLSQLQFNVFDTYQRIAPREYKDLGVRIVDLDDRSLEEVGQWPWPRTKLAELVYRLRQAGAVVVGFDIVFAEPDRTSPARVVESWPQVDGIEALKQQAAALPDHDGLFAQFMAGLGNVVTAVQLTDGGVNRLPRQIGNFSVAGEQGRNIADFVPVLPGAIANLPELEQAAAGNGLISVRPELDGVVRRVPLILALDRDLPMVGKPAYPTLSMEMLRVLQGAPRTMNVRLSGASGDLRWTSSEGVSAIRVGQVTIPSDGQGRMWVHFTGHRDDRYVSAADILAGRADMSLIAGHAVLLGTSAAGLLDLRSSPLNPVLPGVEVHAEMLEQMLDEHFLIRPYWVAEVEMLALLAVGLLLVLVTPRLGALWPAVIGVVLIGGAFAASWWAYRSQLMLVDPVYPALVTLAVYISTSLIGFLRTEGERRQVRTAFSTYLSPALVEQLADHPEKLTLGGETRPMSILFCDVRGFTTISEGFKTNPQGLTKLINRFLTPLTDQILKRSGTIDKYMGDCIMAFWNAPLDVPNHAELACESALAMFTALDALNVQRRAEAQEAGEIFLPLAVGIGVNSGDCVVGNMGSDQRFDYSVLGDAVNLASRLEGQSKSYHVGIVIGPDTARAASGRFAVLELDRIAVKGKNEAVDVFTLLGDSDLRNSLEFQDQADRHARLLKAYRAQHWDEAENLAQSSIGVLDCVMDGFYGMYLERIAEFRTHPPGMNWDGVYVAASK